MTPDSLRAYFSNEFKSLGIEPNGTKRVVSLLIDKDGQPSDIRIFRTELSNIQKSKIKTRISQIPGHFTAGEINEIQVPVWFTFAFNY